MKTFMEKYVYPAEQVSDKLIKIKKAAGPCVHFWYNYKIVWFQWVSGGMLALECLAGRGQILLTLFSICKPHRV